MTNFSPIILRNLRIDIITAQLNMCHINEDARDLTEYSIIHLEKYRIEYALDITIRDKKNKAKFVMQFSTNEYNKPTFTIPDSDTIYYNNELFQDYACETCETKDFVKHFQLNEKIDFLDNHYRLVFYGDEKAAEIVKEQLKLSYWY